MAKSLLRGVCCVLPEPGGTRGVMLAGLCSPGELRAESEAQKKKPQKCQLRLPWDRSSMGRALFSHLLCPESPQVAGMCPQLLLSCHQRSLPEARQLLLP